MSEENRGDDKLLGLFVLGCVLLLPPLVGLASGRWLQGWPALVVYILLVWAGIIAGIAYVVERRLARSRAEDGEADG
ncbi:hypothetical protein ACE4Z5_26020, partial [Salmonella enterica]|uniref:hypothetical protein n=1 Tax=Salmonella enterica TaxID=28901 RepID=UPI003D26B50D